MSKKRLLVFTPTVGIYRVDYYNYLNQIFDLRLVCLYQNISDLGFDVSSSIGSLDFAPCYLNNKGLVTKITYKGYITEVRKYNPDIVLVGEFGQYVLAILIFKFLTGAKFKVISQCDDSYNMVIDHNDFSLKHRIARNLLLPFIDDLIVVEPRVQNYYQKRWHKGLYFPIIRDENKLRDLYRQAIPKANEFANKYNLEGKTVFLYVGRLVKLKNVDRVIKSFSTVNQDNNILVIVGDGTECESLKRLSESLNCDVIFTGRLGGENLYAWYNIASYFILASSQELFGAVVNEALLAGCKCIISNRCGAASLIDENVNGLTFDPDDMEQLNKLFKSLNNTISFTDLKDIKDNLMQISFSKCIEELVSKF